MMPSSRGVALAVCGTFFYALLGLSIKLAGEQANTWQIMIGRALTGMAVAAVLAHVLGVPLLRGRKLGMILTGMANFSAAACVTVALTSIPIFEALVLWYLFPAWTSLLAVRFLGERLTVAGMGFMGLAIAGAIVILWPASGGEDFTLRWGHVAGLCSSFSAAAAFVLIRRHADRHAASHFFYFCLVSLVLSIVPLALHAGPWLPPAAGFPGIAAAALAGCIGQVLIYGSVAYIPPAEVAIITMGEIVIAAVLAYLLFDESLTPRMIVGGIMVIGAGVGINIHKALRTARLRRAVA